MALPEQCGSVEERRALMSTGSFCKLCRIPEHVTIGSCKVAYHKNMSSDWQGQDSP